MSVVQHNNIGDHLRYILNTLDGLHDPIELPADQIDLRLEDINTRLTAFVDAIQTYDFSTVYFGSPIHAITVDVENLVYQVPYSDRAIVRSAIAKIQSSL